jgi:hypothetical protein
LSLLLLSRIIFLTNKLFSFLVRPTFFNFTDKQRKLKPPPVVVAKDNTILEFGNHKELPMLQKQKCPPQVRKLVHKAARDIVKILIDNICLQNPKGEFTPDILPLIKLWQYHCIYYKKDENKIGWCNNIFSQWPKEEDQNQCDIVTHEGLINKDVDTLINERMEALQQVSLHFGLIWTSFDED